MKALSLWQPWATAIAIGAKKIETRGRRMNYRGLIAIHAAKKRSRELDNVSLRLARLIRCRVGTTLPGPSDLSRGAVVAIVEVVTCREMDSDWIAEQSSLEVALGDWRPGRFGIVLRNIRPLLIPFPLRGMQGLWTPTAGTQREILGRAL
ncbi:hypothetical protein LCGC14_1780170 [marine sediment metagenome]|uniref:Uncharacterized protein n=1 Tax=marine sediment metagenome TaxID=412755 RepID=A0A0F9JAK6_9ZZZZ